MKKRLRKKLHKGEFKELGFEINFTFNNEVPAEEDAFWNQFNDIIDANGLIFGGRYGLTEGEGFISTMFPGSATEEQREAVEQCLRNAEEIKSYTLSDLRDAWY